MSTATEKRPRWVVSYKSAHLCVFAADAIEALKKAQERMSYAYGHLTLAAFQEHATVKRAERY